jgi:hypothetical protein
MRAGLAAKRRGWKPDGGGGPEAGRRPNRRPCAGLWPIRRSIGIGIGIGDEKAKPNGRIEAT